MYYEERIAWIIKWIKQEHGLNDPQLGKKWGVDKNTVAAYCNGKGIAKGPVLSSIVKDYGISGEWLIAGNGEPFPGARAKYPEVCGPLKEYEVYAIDTPSPGETGADYGEYIFVPQVSDQISAGGGVTPYNHVKMRIAFRKDWIKRKGDVRNMSLIKVVGDSMEPTLMPGDLVLVNHALKNVSAQGGIYALSINDEIIIKRVQVLYPSGKLKIISDNGNYEPMEATPDQVKINGKVIWYGRDLER